MCQAYGPAVDQSLPDTIQDVLLARMGRLSEAPRRVLQTASVIGREWSLRLLQSLWEAPEPLAAALQELKRQEFVYEQRMGPEPVFVFKHALTQEAASASLLKRKRRQLHRRMAELLAGEFNDVAETQPELLAHHYTAAGLREPAVRWWQRAGERAAERSANAEAISHFRRALELLGSSPAGAERTGTELGLQIALCSPLSAIHGYTADETVAAYTRARELAEQVSEPSAEPTSALPEQMACTSLARIPLSPVGPAASYCATLFNGSLLKSEKCAQRRPF